jgi:type IV secretory pathway TraG/TraD family ATPase VirD4
VKGDPEQVDDRPDFDPAAFHVTLDFTHPEHSARLNLAAGRPPREVGEQLGEALIYDPQAYKAYFVNNAKDALGGLFAAHATAYQTLPSFRQILAYIRDADARKDLLAQLRTTGATDSSDEVLDLRRIDQLLEGKTDVLGNLDLALAPLARGGVSELLTTNNSGVSLSNLLREGARVRVVLPVYKYPRVAPIVGRLILTQFMSAVLSPDCNRSRLKVALVDEAHWFVTPSIADGMADVRHNYGSYVLAFQTLPQIGDETLREKIFSMAGNKLVMAGVGDLDAQKFSAIFGAREQEYISHSTNTGQSTNTSRTRGRGQHSGGTLVGGVAAGGSQQMSTAHSTGLHESAGSNRHTRLRPDWLPSEIRG